MKLTDTFNSRAYSLLIAVSATLVLFSWEGSVGFSLWDEGFLWYGTKQVLVGEVPIRDFMAYDIGRYYWSAAFMRLSGSDGILALRGAEAVIQFLGLFVGLLLISRTAKESGRKAFLFLFLAAVTMSSWMFVRHKLFDISVSIFLIAALAYLVEKPTLKRYLIAGCCVGVAAVFGRNHGVYGAVASLGAMVWLNIKHPARHYIKEFLCWATGVVVGFSPVIAVMLTEPGFASAFGKSIQALLEVSSTNFSLPVPWPWHLNPAIQASGEVVRQLLIGIFFVGLIAFGAISTVVIIYKKYKGYQVSPVVVATSLLALPYAHHAYSRADVGHLAQGIFPLLVGCFAYIATQQEKIRWWLVAVLCGACLWVTYIFQPASQCPSVQGCAEVRISGNDLRMDVSTARDVELVRGLAEQYAREGRSFVVAPFWPGAYALLDRKSPMWGIYIQLQHPLPTEFQLAEIDRIRIGNPGFILIIDLSLDGRNELRFINTHSIVYKYVRENFELLPNTVNPAYQIYRAKNLDLAR